MPALPKEAVWTTVTSRFSTRTELPDAPAFSVGDAIRARNLNPIHHTRSPRYVRGRQGTVMAISGAFPLPDATVLGVNETQWVYRVSFNGRELWGDRGHERDFVILELWEGYLEAV